MRNTVIFFCDASPIVGFGHLNRCLVLAHELHRSGECCVMVGPSKKYCDSSRRAIFKDWITLGEILEDFYQISRLLIKTAKIYNSYVAVLDDYRIDKAFQKNLKEANMHYLLFDNGKRNDIYADIILNTNPIVSKSDYRNKLTNPKAKLLLGPKYSIIRPEFPPVMSKTKSPIKTILITFGGGDDRGAILLVLNALLKMRMQNVEFIVVSGQDNPNNNKIKQWIGSHNFANIELKINPSSIAELFALCDLAIMAGGTTVYEVASIGLPMILISIADNQVKHSYDWSQVTESIKYIGGLEDFQEEILIKVFNQLLCEEGEMVRHNIKMRTTVDGLGRSRVASEIIKIKERYE